ncbi:ComF family protein [Paenibacillus oenotherae]|uniref:ComF family protein n=1 Tax=Paenibacillus oenotherae TaxID=1435645 RepID=A0ABS7D565_9BACL|nr:ComF family protein [Paenibacillus oenotherae]MBW7474999.1 ComF family protein [Paenibacillus oenotherae]
MLALWNKVWRSIPRAAESLAALLRPSAYTCLQCGRKDHFAAASIPLLCRECRDSIPWIVRIHCAVCGRPDSCGDCARRHVAAFICNRSAVRYNDTIRQWLALYKYRGHEGLEPVLGDMLLTAYKRLLQEMDNRQERFRIDAVIPVPVSQQRLQERGFNQSERLAGYIAQHDAIPLLDILRRTRHSGKQSFKTRAERLTDSRGLFAAEETAALQLFDLNPGRRLRLLIVDDIYTTGSTVSACAEAIREELKKHGSAIPAEIYSITLARS